jgi:hypothetical protein
MTAKPVSQEDLIELRRAMANWSFLRSEGLLPL